MSGRRGCWGRRHLSRTGAPAMICVQSTRLVRTAKTKQNCNQSKFSSLSHQFPLTTSLTRGSLTVIYAGRAKLQKQLSQPSRPCAHEYKFTRLPVFPSCCFFHPSLRNPSHCTLANSTFTQLLRSQFKQLNQIAYFTSNASQSCREEALHWWQSPSRRKSAH